MRWDLFCRVIDNHGDAGVCWRLARDLAHHGQDVRLWIDDASSLAWMAPDGHPGVEIRAWDEAAAAVPHGEIVVEAFGCELPSPFIAAMAAAVPPPVWINLEYLSAEGYVERSHGLRSPRFAEPGAGLDKWFFYPGFTAGTGGLLREAGLAEARAGHDSQAWLSAHGCTPLDGERVVSLFCYDSAPLAAWREVLAARPTLLLVAPGAPQRLVDTALPAASRPAGLRIHPLPWLTQDDYDRLLWSCDLNFVRGEDSFVRAQWAEVPFLWHIYPQHDGAHVHKLDAFLARFLAGQEAATGAAIGALFRAWNGLEATPPVLQEPVGWAAACQSWAAGLRCQPPLTEQLIAFCQSRKVGCC